MTVERSMQSGEDFDDQYAREMFDAFQGELGPQEGDDYASEETLGELVWSGRLAHTSFAPRATRAPRRCGLSPARPSFEPSRARPRLAARSRRVRERRERRAPSAAGDAGAEPPPPRALGRTASGAAQFVSKRGNSKPAPVDQLPGRTRPGLKPQPPFVAATIVSIAATCWPSCPFRSGGCCAVTGLTGFVARRLDAAVAGLSPDEVIAEEADLIDRAFRCGRVPQDGAKGGRDLRLHVAGDVGSAAGTRMLAGAARRWQERGPVAVLASVERPQDIEHARARAYAAAIVVERFPSARAVHPPGSTAKIVRCPAELVDGAEEPRATCVRCRLYFDRDLLALNIAIAFEVHGPGSKEARLAIARSLRGNQEHPDSGDNSLGKIRARDSKARTPRSGGAA